MGTGFTPRVGDIDPGAAWEILRDAGSDACLIDVRTRAEWGFVGVPDLTELGGSPLFAEWAAYPGMSVNPRFAEEVVEQLGSSRPETFLFLCRSGARSLRAAQAVALHLSQDGWNAVCLNVAEGFEGDLDGDGHRGRINGWKVRGLPWRQT